MKFIALPGVNAPDMHASGLEEEFRRAKSAAGGRGDNPIDGSPTLAAMFQSIRNALAANNHDCMELLEIDAHGNPGLCDGIALAGAAAFGTQLRSVSLCDNVHIYLSACNTGVRSSFNESLAQAVSRHTPTEAADNIRVTVYGSVGYLGGTHMEDNADTTRNVFQNGHYYVTYPDVFAGGVRHRGSLAARGAASFRGFREGNPV